MTDKPLTGYPSIDKPWLKYYSEEAINAPLPEYSLYDYLYSNNRNNLDVYALNYFGNKITYKTLFALIDKAAKAFLEIGVREGEIIPIVSVSTVASVICFYALNRIGAVVDYLNVLSTKKDLEFYFREANARIVVTLDLFGEKVTEAAIATSVQKIVAFNLDYEMPIPMKIGYRLKSNNQRAAWKSFPNVITWDDFMALGKKQMDINYTKDPYKMCLLSHTGGTTGTPKAVMVNDFAMNAVANFYKQNFIFHPGEIWANVIIPFVIYGILNCLHMPLTLGLTVVLIPKFEASEWNNYLKKYKFNYILAAPAYVNPLLKDKRLSQMDLSNILLCGVGGDGMNKEMEIALNQFLHDHGAKGEIIKGYGLSEVCATAVTGLIGVNKIGSVGIPITHNNLMVCEPETFTELSYNEVGEICLQCTSRMIGYMNNDEATRQLFRIHDDGSEWLHTGDLGYVDEDGFLFLVGRMKRIILTVKDGVGYKVFPNMSEKVLDENEFVIQSCIVGITSGTDQVLLAFIEVSKDNLSHALEIESKLRSYCEKKLPSYAQPTFYEFRDSLPLTASGKIDYRALEKMAEEAAQ